MFANVFPLSQILWVLLENHLSFHRFAPPVPGKTSPWLSWTAKYGSPEPQRLCLRRARKKSERLRTDDMYACYNAYEYIMLLYVLVAWLKPFVTCLELSMALKRLQTVNWCPVC